MEFGLNKHGISSSSGKADLQLREVHQQECMKSLVLSVGLMLIQIQRLFLASPKLKDLLLSSCQVIYCITPNSRKNSIGIKLKYIWSGDFGNLTSATLPFHEAACRLDTPTFPVEMFFRWGKSIPLVEGLQLSCQRLDFRQQKFPGRSIGF